MENDYFAGLIAEYCNYEPSATELNCKIPWSEAIEVISAPTEDKVRLVNLDQNLKTLNKGKDAKYYANIMLNVLPSYVWKEFQDKQFKISRILSAITRGKGEKLQVCELL